MPRHSEEKPRGRTTAYAYFIKFCHNELKKKNRHVQVAFVEFSKQCAARWRSMSDRQKVKFADMARKDKRRYEKEMRNYSPSHRSRMTKDPNAPKRPLTAFFLFARDERDNVKEDHPEYKPVDTSRELGRRWAAAEPSVKARYQELAVQERARFDREMSRYKSRRGH